MASERLSSQTIICRGGLDSNRNWLELSNLTPGTATSLVNFEPSLYGGYRRINGYAYLESTDTGEVDPSGAEGKILGVHVSSDYIYAMRKQQSGATYEFYSWVPGASWSKFTTGLTLVSTGVEQVRFESFNVVGSDQHVFTDGVNNATLFDGTTWINIDPAATGADYANAGGAQALAAPHYAAFFEGHLFVARCSGACNIVAHSAPNAEYDWTSASGAGQLNLGMRIIGFKAFRDKLIVFGENRIKTITVEGTDFVVTDVTVNLGLRATNSVLEVNGDIIFLSPDGVRPFSATDRIGDFDINSISKKIQQDILDLSRLYTNTQIHGVVIKDKSQFRLFFSSSTGVESSAPGIVGGLTNGQEGTAWEFGLLRGIKVSCVDSGYYGSPLSEYVVHGDFAGKVFQQEIGNSFNDENIYAEYSTPYLDFQSPSIRKTPHRITMFARPEGAVSLNTGISYDWGNEEALNPSGYAFASTGSPTVYGTAVYGTSEYGSISNPAMLSNVQGSGMSMRITTSTNDQSAPYTIQGLVVVYKENGFK